KHFLSDRIAGAYLPRALLMVAQGSRGTAAPANRGALPRFCISVDTYLERCISAVFPQPLLAKRQRRISRAHLRAGVAAIPGFAVMGHDVLNAERQEIYAV